MLELLNQLDGFDTRGDVKVIMATNKIESLDPALIRPGRIDRKIEFPLPDVKTKRKRSKKTTAVEEQVTAHSDAAEPLLEKPRKRSRKKVVELEVEVVPPTNIGTESELLSATNTENVKVKATKPPRKKASVKKKAATS